MMFYAILFLCGAAVLALELLASRIMTPYFGVSLYIWTGILSITLIALALGYWAGGRLASGKRSTGNQARLTLLFALMPAVASLAIAGACLAYPWLFPRLASADLVLGAFGACLFLLFVPLFAASAMNPLLVAILLARGGGRPGDAGAGRVFFVSTLGSVAGVLATGFGLIHYLTNFSATLAVALLLALLSLAAAARPPAPLAGRVPLGLAGAAALTPQRASIALTSFAALEMGSALSDSKIFSSSASSSTVWTFSDIGSSVADPRRSEVPLKLFLRVWFRGGRRGPRGPPRRAASPCAP